MTKLRVLDLFSGIGGFSLGLDRTGGFETVAFCEIEEYPRKVLAKHWPKVPIYHDVRTLTADALRRDGIAVDVICGGFPCQDISFAGKGAGLAGERSGLWREYARLIGELRPRFVIVENVAALLGRGLGAVLGDLAALGYDAEWHCIPASAVGAPHRRDRLWLVAYPGGEQHEGYSLALRRAFAAQFHAADANSESEHAGSIDAEVAGTSQHDPDAETLQRFTFFGGEPNGDHQRAEAVADAYEFSRNERWQGDTAKGQRGRNANRGCQPKAKLANAELSGCERWDAERRRSGPAMSSGWWLSEPDVGRVADDVPRRVDRLKCLGNAVVNEIPFRIGRAILQAEGLTKGGAL